MPKPELIYFVLPLAAAAMLVVPAPAQACQCVPDPIYRSDPVDGARDVALNQAIMVEGVYKPSTARLEDGDGNPVEVEVNEGPWPGCPGTSADLLPKKPLAPNTRYVLRVEPIYPEHLAGFNPPLSATLSFTTGERTLPDVALEPPPKAAASVLHSGPEGFCAPHRTYACLGFEESDDLELIMRKGDRVLLRTATLVHSDGNYGLEDVPDCIELRRRARTGKRSEPTKLCGDDLPTRAFEKGDADETGLIACRDGRIGDAANAGVESGEQEAPAQSGAPAGVAPPVAGSQAPRADVGLDADGSDEDNPEPPQPFASSPDAHVNACAATYAPLPGKGEAAIGCIAAVGFALILRGRRRRR